jgi:hypothetical protein
MWSCDVTVRFGKIALLLAALGACGVVRAELAWTVSAAAPSVCAASAAAISPDVGPRLADLSWLLDGMPASAVPAPSSSSAPAGTTGTVLNVASDRELPPGPSSLALGLGALGCLGAYQVGRSVKKIHFGALPAWYHSDAVQVGHVTPLPLNFGALPVCEFDEPVGRPALAHRIPREPGSRLRSQFFLLVESPRGPPQHT